MVSRAACAAYMPGYLSVSTLFPSLFSLSDYGYTCGSLVRPIWQPLWSLSGPFVGARYRPTERGEVVGHAVS